MYFRYLFWVFLIIFMLIVLMLVQVVDCLFDDYILQVMIMKVMCFMIEDFKLLGVIEIEILIFWIDGVYQFIGVLLSDLLQ